jgi:hypothetical protein
MIQMRWLCAILLLALLPSSHATAQGQPGRDAERFRRRPASARYVDTESRFSLQGYVTGTFADFEDDFPRLEFPPPGQLLVPRTGVSSFQYDWALFLGSRLSEHVSFVVETHFVTKGDGDFRPDIVTTEAQVVWSPIRDGHSLRVALGQYWAPFAGINDDWFSAVNRFGIVPLASRAFPAHYNERGVRLEGEFDLGGDRGLNYALSLGNGVSGMSIEDQHGVDSNEDKALMGRVGLFPVGPELEVGLSAMTGRFRDVGDVARPTADPRRYRARFDAYGVDAQFTRPRVEARSYGVLSWERLDGPGDLRRWGVMAETAVRPAPASSPLRRLWVKARWDRSRLDRLGEPADDDTAWNAGVEYRIHARSRVSLSGFFHDERSGRQLHDDGLIVQLTASF